MATAAPDARFAAYDTRFAEVMHPANVAGLYHKRHPEGIVVTPTFIEELRQAFQRAVRRDAFDPGDEFRVVNASVWRELARQLPQVWNGQRTSDNHGRNGRYETVNRTGWQAYDRRLSAVHDSYQS